VISNKPIYASHWRQSLLWRTGDCPPAFCAQWASTVACPTTFLFAICCRPSVCRLSVVCL